MSKQALPQLNLTDFEPQIIWLLIIFSLFYIILKIYIVPYFFSETENREQYILNNYQDAKKLQKKAERLSEEHSEKLQAVHLRANDLIIEAGQKLRRRLGDEKIKLNNEMNVKFKEKCSLIDSQIDCVDKDLLVEIDVIKQLARSKLSMV